MRVLNNDELDVVAGGGWLYEIFEDARKIVDEANEAYADAIGAATDMMCTGTGNC